MRATLLVLSYSPLDFREQNIDFPLTGKFFFGGAEMRFGFFIAGVAALWGGTVQAQVTDGYTRAQFQAAAAGSSALTTQNFDGFPNGTTLLTDGSVNYSSSNGSPLVTSTFLTSTNPNGLGRTGVGFFLATDTATFTFNSAITAFAIDINTFASNAGAYRFALNTGDVGASIFETFPGAGTGQFIGLTSLTPFTSVTVSARDNFAFTLDTLIYGSRAPVTGAIPEPGTWVLLVVGFGFAGTMMRHRNAVQKRAIAA